MKSTEDQSTTYVLTQSFMEQLPLVVKQCLFHASNKSDHLQLRPGAAIILQCLHCFGNVTSRNICLYRSKAGLAVGADCDHKKSILPNKFLQASNELY